MLSWRGAPPFFFPLRVAVAQRAAAVPHKLIFGLNTFFFSGKIPVTNIPNRLGHLQSKSRGLHTMVVSSTLSCPSCGTERANGDASDLSKCVSES